MKRFYRIVLLGILLLSLCLLTGCLKSEVLDSKAKALVTALNSEDFEFFKENFYMNESFTEEMLFEGYTQVLSQWKPVDPESIKLVSINIRKEHSNGQSTKQYTGAYRFEQDKQPFQMTLEYIESDEIGKFLRFNMQPTQAYSDSSSAADLISNISMLVHLVCFALVIVDIIRKHRAHPVLLLILAILYFRFTVNQYTVTLPLGSIIYWCVRKKLPVKSKAQPTNEVMEEAAIEYDEDESSDSPDDSSPA